jgi:hypothetical protein
MMEPKSCNLSIDRFFFWLSLLAAAVVAPPMTLVISDGGPKAHAQHDARQHQCAVNLMIKLVTNPTPPPDAVIGSIVAQTCSLYSSSWMNPQHQQQLRGALLFTGFRILVNAKKNKFQPNYCV